MRAAGQVAGVSKQLCYFLVLKLPGGRGRED